MIDALHIRPRRRLLATLMVGAVALIGALGACTPMQVFPALESLAGPPWTLAAWQSGEPVGEGIEISLVYLDGRLVGRAGCNRYVMPVTDGYSPGRIIPGKAVLTRMACAEQAMVAEARFVERLARVDRFELRAGELQFIDPAGGAKGALVFARR